MKIVVEGYDASGKSTLAQALAEKYGLELVEAGPAPPNDFTAMYDSAKQLEMLDTVHSRITPISRQAYQFDSSFAHTELLKDLLARFVSKGAIFIYCCGKATVHITKDYDTPEHLAFIEKNELEIRANYEKIFSKLPYFRYDFTTDKIEDVICYIEQIVQHS